MANYALVNNTNTNTNDNMKYDVKDNEEDDDIDITSINGIIDFLYKLKNLIIHDLTNSYYFIIANKNYFTWITILYILLQFTSIDSLCKYKEKINQNAKKINNKYDLKGGAESAPATIPATNDGKNATSNGKNATSEGKPPDEGEGEGKPPDEGEDGGGAGAQGPKGPGFFSRGFSRFSEGTKKAFLKLAPGKKYGQYGKIGPVFGSLVNIFDKMKYIFYILAIILVFKIF